MKNIISLVVDKNSNGQRVDLFISKKEYLSRTRIKNLIIKGNLKINHNNIFDPSKKYF